MRESKKNQSCLARKLPSRRALLAVIITGGVWVTGCAGDAPVVSQYQHSDDSSILVQRAWVAARVDEVIAVTGTEDDWESPSRTGKFWHERRADLLDEARAEACSFESGQKNPAALEFEIWSVPLERSSFELADRIRDMWEADSWRVGDVIRREDTAAGQNVMYRADRPDGTGLVIEASENDGRNILRLQVRAWCSNHETMAW